MSAKDARPAVRFLGAMECTIPNSYLFPAMPAGYCRLLSVRERQGTVRLSREEPALYDLGPQSLLLQAGESLVVCAAKEPVRLLCAEAECIGKSLPPFACLKREARTLSALLERTEAGKAARESELERLIDAFCRERPGEERAPGRSPVYQSPAVLLRAILDTRYAESLRLDDFSEQLYTNKFRLLREFKKQYGVPPIEYLLRRRVEKAAELLAGTALKVWEIGNQVGFGNPTYFTRAFCARKGCTPLEYRKRSRGV